MTDRALLFTDLVESTRFVAALGDARAAAFWSSHDRGARDLLAAHGGREIDRSDGFFFVFDDVSQAAAFALAYLDMLEPLGVQARLGMHVGDVVERANRPDDVARGARPIEVDGLAKPLAARLMALARGGQALLSLAAAERLSAHQPLDAALRLGEPRRHGHYRLKGIDAPVEIFELGRRGQASFAPPADADKAYRVVWSGELWRPVRDIHHNLPAERDAFIGRTAELSALARCLDDGARLVTLVGTGGTGKTRFVRRYAWNWLGDWPDG